MGFLKSIGKIASVAAPVVGAVTGQRWIAAPGSALGGLAVTNEPDIRLDCYMVVKHSRVMPTYSVPMLNNRF